ncbi:hypothetical protein PR202_ga24657 [Eleusine coracana subsp. coracana]|uniref:Uncharacterized protein n=1 Tax=Eleusine coracana subsp. coracana TaxID=191504 RepID=A0AAV5D9I3_ELECO|nr:hypothetical protein PR202_ga24657 [Eleusine coracana subsp. coracana]
MADAGSSRGAAARSISDLKAPLWDFVTTIEKPVTMDDLSQMRRAIAAAAAELDRSKAKPMSLPTSNNNKRQSGPPTELEKAWKIDQHNHMNSLIARSFYSGDTIAKIGLMEVLVVYPTPHKGNERAEDLIYVHSNLRLLSRSTDGYKKGDTRMWDVGEDSFDSLSGVGILEVANLSINEPELQAVSFGDVDMELIDDNDANAT